MLLQSKEFSEELFNAIGRAKGSLIIFSAFVKTNAFEKFIDLLEGKDVKIKLVARWQKHDLLTGASDLEVYKLCSQNGWKFGIDLNLHGKLFLIDYNEIFLGSANLTRNGLNLGIAGNNEFGTKLSANEIDLLKIEKIFQEEVTWIDDSLYKEIRADIFESEPDSMSIVNRCWSKALNRLLLKRVEYLWIKDLLCTSPSSLMSLNLDVKEQLLDFELLNLDLDAISKDSIKNGFRNTRIYQWVINNLLDKNEVRFGEWSSLLHKSILDSKAPYRKEIKEYVSVLFSWFEFLDDEFEVIKYNITSSVKLKEDNHAC